MLGKFFPFYEFKNGIGAGGIALFVGLVELMLEFVKPVTLSMRLFGNIYGGEVALGVITALTIAFIPVGLLGLEVMLNAIQALIFSILTLDVHRPRDREPRATRRATSPRRRSTPSMARSASSSQPTDAAPIGATTTVPMIPAAGRGVGGTHDMDYTGAGLAALGVIGPGIGIGILGGLAATGDRSQPRRGRTDPRHRDHPRGVRRGPRRPRDRRRPARDLHPARSRTVRSDAWTSWPSRPGRAATPSSWPPKRVRALFQINLFWVIVSALNFILFFAIIWAFAFKPVSRMLAERKDEDRAGPQGRRTGAP